MLRLRQGGKRHRRHHVVSTHGTSLTDANRLISADNKGYASYLWNRTSPG